MNMNELKTYVKGLEYFNFQTHTPEEASAVTYGRVEPDEFKEPGLYRVMSGSRGVIEEVERMNLDDFNIPTVDDIIDEGQWDCDEDFDGRLYVEEFYMVSEDEENPGTLMFSFTEEEYDHFILVQ